MVLKFTAMELLVRSELSTSRVPLGSSGEWSIGRHPDSDVVINDPKASRRHGLLTAEDGNFFIEDLGTGNGTRISGVSIPANTRIAVKEDDVIEIGSLELTVVESSSAEDTPEDVSPEGKVGVLTGLSGGVEGKVFAIGEEPLLIGRLPVCQVRIDEPQSSRIHTEVSGDKAGFSLKDLGSSNGTFLNEEKVRRSAIRHGDVIRVGDHKFSFNLVDEDEAPQPESAVVTHAPAKAAGGRSVASFGCSTSAAVLTSALLSGAAVFFYLSNVRDQPEPTGMVPGMAIDFSGGTGAAAGPGGSGTGASEEGDDAPSGDPAPVVIGSPIRADIPTTLEKTGNVQLARQDIIPFEVGRKVEKVHVVNRQRVEKDAPLVTFEMTEALSSARMQATSALNQAKVEIGNTESEVAKAVAALSNAEKNLEIIENTYKRSLPVYENGNLLQTEWDEILTKRADAQASVRMRIEEIAQAERSVSQSREKVIQMQADLNDVQSKIDDLTVKAAAAGVVDGLDLKDGYTVNSRNSTMELIEFEREVKAVVSVSEDEIVQFRDGLEVDAWLDRAPEKVFRGKVTFIPPTATNRNYDVEVMIPNEGFHFRPGQQVFVRFITERKEGGIVLPVSVLGTNPDTGFHVFVVDPETEVAELVPVRRGAEFEMEQQKLVEVVPLDTNRELSEEDWIIFEGHKAVKGGMQVSILNRDQIAQ